MSEHYDDFDRALLRAGKKASAPTSRMRARALGVAAGAGAATAAATTKAAAATKVGALAKATKTILAMKLTMVAAVTTASVGTAVYVVETRAEKNETPMVVATPIATTAASPNAKSPVPIAAPPPAETIAETEPAVEAAPPRSETPAPTPTPKPAPMAKVAPLAPPVDPAPNVAPVVSAKPAVDPLREELALVEDARRSLAASDPSSTLRLVDDHARRFPSGAFAVERDVLRIDALVLAGRRDEAVARAREFLAHHPGSAQARRIAKITETNP